MNSDFRCISFTQRHVGANPDRSDPTRFGVSQHARDLCDVVNPLSGHPVILVAWSLLGPRRARPPNLMGVCFGPAILLCALQNAVHDGPAGPPARCGSSPRQRTGALWRAGCPSGRLQQEPSSSARMSASSSLLGSCDEPDILLSQTTPVCLMGADPGQFERS